MGTPRLGRRKITLEEDTVRISFEIPATLHKRLIELARQDRRSLAQEIITLLERGVERNPEDSIPELILAVERMLEAQAAKHS